MKSPAVFLGVLAALLLAAWGRVAAAPPLPLAPGAVDEAILEAVRGTVEAASAPDGLTVEGERIGALEALRQFYVGRCFFPAWVKGGEPFGAVGELVVSLQRASEEGLLPAEYHLVPIRRILAEARRGGRTDGPGIGRLAALEMLCTDAFLLLGSHLQSGRVDPETFDPEWVAARRKGDMAATLEAALSGEGVAEGLARLAPSRPGYRRLKEALARYRVIAESGGWGEVGPGPALKAGQRGPRVEALRRILLATGDLGPEAETGAADLADARLVEALSSFQRRHGLEDDGVAGQLTVAALDRAVGERVRQIELNLERWRWLPRDLGRRHIIVNIADFRLDVIEEDRKVMTMGVVVGQPFRRTPVFSGRITYLVFNPYWNVPRTIALKDKLPLIRKDPGWLAAQGMRVLQGWGADTREIDPSTVDWTAAGRGNFPYRLRQDPGPRNALGRVKFMLPNKFDVYLHDTPSQELFERRERPFSSGCIRLQSPLALASYLLAADPKWTPEAIAAVIAEGRERTVGVPGPIDVHLLYWTAWVEDDGTLNFRDDLYGRDRKLEEAWETRRFPEEG